MNVESLILLSEEIYGVDHLVTKEIKTHIGCMKFAKENCVIEQIWLEKLSESELLTIIMLIGTASDIIQRPAYDPSLIDELAGILISNLDSALSKSPKCNHGLLYRQDRYSHGEFLEREIVEIKGYFTTSTDDFDHGNCLKWIIKPLDEAKTKARNIYEIYNHGKNLPYPEYQVEFERCTSFLITKIERVGEYDVIYIDEME